jgi:hypothetical protein
LEDSRRDLTRSFENLAFSYLTDSAARATELNALETGAVKQHSFPTDFKEIIVYAYEYDRTLIYELYAYILVVYNSIDPEGLEYWFSDHPELVNILPFDDTETANLFGDFFVYITNNGDYITDFIGEE